MLRFNYLLKSGLAPKFPAFIYPSSIERLLLREFFFTSGVKEVLPVFLSFSANQKQSYLKDSISNRGVK